MAVGEFRADVKTPARSRGLIALLRQRLSPTAMPAVERLNDHLLHDIGLNRADLAALAD